MKIIFEGVDKVGKSTQIKKLSQKLNYKIKKFKVPSDPISAKNMYYNELKEKDDIIYDRFFYSEYVYGKYIRNYEINYLKDIEEKFKDSYLIVLVSNLSKIKENFDYDYIGLKDIEPINNKFKIIYENSSIKHKILIDTSKNDIDKTFNIILNFLGY